MPRGRRPRGHRRYHIHAPGFWYVAVTLFIALGAINSQNNLLFSALGLAVGGLLVSGILSGGALLGLSVQRRVPISVPLGKPLHLTYRVSNANRLVPAMGLHISEQASDSDLQVSAGWPAFFDAAGAFIVQIPAGRASQQEAIVLPRRRGKMTLGPLRVWTTFPFGLVKKSITFAQPQVTIVLPPVLELRSGLVKSLLAPAPIGLGSEQSTGTGEEFFGIREYVPGDSLRRIAWRRSARTGDLVVRQHASPSPVRLWLVLRLLPDGPGAQRLNERAIALGASILRGAEESGVAVGLAVPESAERSGSAPDWRLSRPRPGRGHVERLLTELALIEPGSLRVGDPFPDPAARGGACVIVHAGASDRTFGPRHALHLGAAQAEQYFRNESEAARILAIFDPPAHRAPGRGRGLGSLVRRVVRRGPPA